MGRVCPIQCQETIAAVHQTKKTWHKFYLVRIWLEWCVICVGNAVLFSTNSQYPDCETAWWNERGQKRKRKRKINKEQRKYMYVCVLEKPTVRSTEDCNWKHTTYSFFLFIFMFSFSLFFFDFFFHSISYTFFVSIWKPEYVRFSKLPHCRSYNMVDSVRFSWIIPLTVQQSLIKNRFRAFTKMHLLWAHFINITMNGEWLA